MFAIIKSGGKQYTVKPGDVLKVDSINAEVNSDIQISDVLAVSVGKPFVSNAVVTATVLDQIKDDKILVFKRRRRKDYKSRFGHRSHLTVLKIGDIKVG